jgi:NTP pyrophosphatase (non-canonical NTP hydrolase)
MNGSTSSELHRSGCISYYPLGFQQAFRRFLSRDVENPVHNCPRNLSTVAANPMIARHGPLMPKRRHAENQNLLYFPELDVTTSEHAAYSGVGELMPSLTTAKVAVLEDFAKSPGANCDVVISGSYRKDFESLRNAFEEFRDLGCKILSPSNVSIVSEQEGFVYMKGEETETPENIEDRHLSAIQKANFVWLHTPEGYVGPSAALEVGFAHAAGVPVFAKELPRDKILQSFVQVVASPRDVLNGRLNNPGPPAPALKAFQEYYRRAALQRGYAKEGPKDCLLLMVEEVGELARALRKREKLVRHGSYPDSSEAQELADVFLYVVHMANVLELDLANIVRDKEVMNLQKFLAR